MKVALKSLTSLFAKPVGTSRYASRFLAVILCVFFISIFSTLQAESSKKYNLSICAIFRNEAKFLKEWIEYHRLIGVDHFYLYNNNSIDRFREVLNPYIKAGVVTLIQWPDRLGALAERHPFMWTFSTRIPAYENAAILRAPKETKWLVFVDVDEFLVPANANTITEVLENYNEQPGIILSSICFDASEIDALPKRSLIIETTELTATPEQNIQQCVEKMIFKPEFCRGFTCSPYQCLFKENLAALKMDTHEVRINRYINRNKGYFHSGRVKGRLQVDNRLLTENEVRLLLETGYEIEDQERAVYRFMPEMFKRMGYGPKWNW